MGLDTFRKRELDQVKHDSKIMDEAKIMGLDPDLAMQLYEIDSGIKMEKTMLERKYEYERMNNTTSKRSLDIMPHYDVTESSFSNNHQEPNREPNQDEEENNLKSKYTEESARKAKENIERTTQKVYDLLAGLEAAIGEHTSVDSLDEQQPTKHR